MAAFLDYFGQSCPHIDQSSLHIARSIFHIARSSLRIAQSSTHIAGCSQHVACSSPHCRLSPKLIWFCYPVFPLFLEKTVSGRLYEYQWNFCLVFPEISNAVQVISVVLNFLLLWMGTVYVRLTNICRKSVSKYFRRVCLCRLCRSLCYTCTSGPYTVFIFFVLAHDAIDGIYSVFIDRKSA